MMTLYNADEYFLGGNQTQKFPIFTDGEAVLQPLS